MKVESAVLICTPIEIEFKIGDADVLQDKIILIVFPMFVVAFRKVDNAIIL